MPEESITRLLSVGGKGEPEALQRLTPWSMRSCGVSPVTTSVRNRLETHSRVLRWFMRRTCDW